MAFKAVIEDASLFKDCVRAISELIGEGIFRFDENGMKFIATDPTMVVLVDLNLAKNCFEELNVEDEIKLPINIDAILSILKRVRSSDRLILESSEENKLTVVLEGKVKRRFILPLIDIEEKEIPNLNLEFLANITVHGKSVVEGITDLAAIADVIAFEAKEDAFIMRGEGDLSKGEIIMEKGCEDLLELEVKEPCRSKFSVDYLKKIATGIKAGGITHIQLGNDFPLEVKTEVTDNSTLRYVLAPRVED